ncbi:MAG: hypothetical protein KA458_12855, partial [Saprospiraceae bacterium]|nr:hypothetical protein [Saprospiraceae bacterium]
YFGTIRYFFQSRPARAPLSRLSGIAAPGVGLLSDAFFKFRLDDVFANHLQHTISCVVGNFV